MKNKDEKECSCCYDDDETDDDNVDDDGDDVIMLIMIGFSDRTMQYRHVSETHG